MTLQEYQDTITEILGSRKFISRVRLMSLLFWGVMFYTCLVIDLAIFSATNNGWYLLPLVVWWWAMYQLLSTEIPEVLDDYVLEIEVRNLYAKYFNMDVSNLSTKKLHQMYRARES